MRYELLPYEIILYFVINFENLLEGNKILAFDPPFFLLQQNSPMGDKNICFHKIWIHGIQKKHDEKTNPM